MALGTLAYAGSSGGGATHLPIFFKRVSFNLDAAYATGGYLNFSTFLQTLLGSGKTVLGVIQASSANGYSLEWNRATDALQIFTYTVGPKAELGNGLDAATLCGAGVEMLVIAS